MGRSTVYNDDLTQDWSEVNKENKKLLKEFINYCVANDKSPQTCKQYEAQLKVFFCWNLRENNDKFFVDIKKRDYVNFFGQGRVDMGWSPNRLSSFRAVLSSLSNFIERILDEDYPAFRNIVKVLEPISLSPVRDKTIIDEENILAATEKLVENNEIQKACWLALLFSSGMRKAEATQMKVEFFTDDKIVFDGMAYATPKIRTKGRGIKGKQVSRYIFKETFDKYLNMWKEKRKELGIDSEYLFVSKKGDKWESATIGTFNSWAKIVGRDVGIEDLYCHSLRHAFTTELKKRGYPDEVVRKIQNWSSTELVGVYNDRSQEDELNEFFKKIKNDVNKEGEV